MLKKYYEFDGVFNTFDEIDNNRHELHKYNARTSNMINRKIEMLEHLKIMQWKLMDMFSTSFVVRKIKNANYKGYVNRKLNEEMNNGDKCHAEAIFDSFKFKRLERIKAEKPLEGDEVKIADLSDMSLPESDEELVKSKPEETIAERVKLNPRKKKSRNKIIFNIISTKKSWE